MSTDLNDVSWITRSENADSANLEFPIWLIFEVATRPGFPNGGQVIPIKRRPQLVPTAGQLDSQVALSNIKELIEHYLEVLQIAEEYQIPYKYLDEHFCIQLEIRWSKRHALFRWFSTEEELFFPNEELERSRRFLRWVVSAQKGQSWTDINDGGDTLAYFDGSRFFFRQIDRLNGKDWANVSIPAEPLRDSIPPALERIEQVVGFLVEGVGTDYWTEFRRDLI